VSRDCSRADPAATYYEARDLPDSEWVAEQTFEELTTRDLHARVVAAAGVIPPESPSGPDVVEAAGYAPLSVVEHLAAGEVLVRSYRHPWYVDRALRAGATWQQAADAAGCTEEQARVEYRSWAEGERRARAAHDERRWADREGRFGMDDAEYAAAMRRAGEAQPDSAAERAAAGPGAILCAHADRDGQGAHWLRSGEKCTAPEATRESQMEAGQ
jgi:hypothetical protein